jgi:hypothetical protein
MSLPPATLVLDMASVIELATWRRGHALGSEEDPRLEGAVARLDHALSEQPWRRPPPWLVTELLAIQGAVSMGLVDEAATRSERLAERLERIASRVRARAR